jgi:hypothetical protein
MPCSPELTSFIRTHFPSIWTLEVLLFIRKSSSVAWRKAQLVKEMRASESVIGNALRSLHAGGLIVLEADDSAKYGTATEELDKMVEHTQALYALKPGAVRSLILNSAAPALSAFSASFKFRRDP